MSLPACCPACSAPLSFVEVIRGRARCMGCGVQFALPPRTADPPSPNQLPIDAVIASVQRAASITAAPGQVLRQPEPLALPSRGTAAIFVFIAVAIIMALMLWDDPPPRPAVDGIGNPLPEAIDGPRKDPVAPLPPRADL